VERYDGFRRFDIIGRRVPIYCISLRKSLLTDMSVDSIRSILRRRPPLKLISRTITDIEKNIADIEVCRLRGRSSDIEEYEESVMRPAGLILPKTLQSRALPCFLLISFNIEVST